jgi:outer membrane protein OmpA-like peptidoglycan-associated protein
MFGTIAQLFAQEQPIKKQVADNLFERYEYAKAVVIYLDLADKNNNKIQVIERIADCYRLINDYDNSEKWYQKTVGKPDAAAIDAYYYAEALLRNKKFDEAREQYKQYYAKAGNNDELQFKLATCDSAMAWMKSSSLFTIKNEQRFNTNYSEWGLNYFGETGFVFTSDRKDEKKKGDTYERTGNGFYKLYQSDGDITIPFPIIIKEDLFKGEYNIGPMALNPTQDTAYVTISTTVAKSQLPVDKDTKGTQRLYTRRLLLYMVTKVNKQWSNFVSFPYNNIKEYSVGNATVSKNGNVIYFTSDMPGGEGETDIWYCVKQANGSWDKPVNCGKMINTKNDEAFPVLNGDGALYYSSNGLPGMGGYDIFRAHGEKGTWSKPENLKYPVNSTSDDICYITRDSLSGFFSSNRENGQGSDDIYKFSYKPVIKTIPQKAVSEPPVITATPPPPPPSVIPLNIKKGESFVLKNIYYDVNKSNIRPDAAVELDKLIDALNEHPSMRIEISSHTDSRAPAVYNMALSNRRAAGVVSYLVDHGIARDRLVPKGYGDTRLLNECEKGVHCTEAQHQLNRRTEVKILSE